MTSALRLFLPLIGAACLATAARAEVPAGSVRDEAGLFRPETVARAEQQIDDLRRSFDRNLFVQTVRAAPEHQRKMFRFLYSRQVNRILAEQARKLADESGPDGIFVVICNDPRDVHVVVRPEDDPDFTPHDADDLRRTVARRLHDAGPDGALPAIVGQVRAALRAHAARGRSTSAVSEYVLAGLLGGGVVLWLLLCLLRYKLRTAHLFTEPDDGAASPRRRTALLGAMFGTPAGLWLYDKLYPPPPHDACLLAGPAAPEGRPAENTRVEGTPAHESPEDAPVSP